MVQEAHPNPHDDHGSSHGNHGHDDQNQGGGGCCDDSGQACGAGLEKIYPTTAVRWGQMRRIGEFSHPEGMVFGCGANVVIKTKRGLEVGEQVSLSCGGCDKSVTREQIRSYIENSGAEFYEFEAGRILRLATEDDNAEWDRIQTDALRMRASCQRLADEHRLEMKIVTAEPLLGGERVVFYFTSEGRVDFRSLVKDLAHEFQTRIEMRQVGARDEARLVADYETCGRECCCKNFLKKLKPVSMKMAKMQKATLDPSKVSGRCGRLKCCLRYEHTSYEELDRKLPRIGARVFTERGEGTVVDRQILTQLLQVQTEAGGRLAVTVEDLLTQEESQLRQAEAKQRQEEARKQLDEQRKRDAAARRERKQDRPSGGGSAEPTKGEGKRKRRRPASTNRGQQKPADGAKPADGTRPADGTGPKPERDATTDANASPPEKQADKPRGQKRRRRRSRGRPGPRPEGNNRDRGDAKPPESNDRKPDGGDNTGKDS